MIVVGKTNRFQVDSPVATGKKKGVRDLHKDT